MERQSDQPSMEGLTPYTLYKSITVTLGRLPRRPDGLLAMTVLDCRVIGKGGHHTGCPYGFKPDTA